MNKKHLAISCLSILLIVSIFGFFLVFSPSVGMDQEDNGYFYSESDGRYIKKGQFWHKPDSKNHFSVRYDGFSSDVPDNVKDVYICVNDINRSQSLTLSFQMYNHENRELWFTIEDNNTTLSQTADYSLSTKEMGSVVGSGGLNDSWTYTVNINNIPSSLSSKEVTDTIDLRISSWEDSGYSSLYTRDNLDIKIHYIDREHMDWNLVSYENFDDQIIDNWYPESVNTQGESFYSSYGGLEINSDIYRSADYSMKVYVADGGDYKSWYVNSPKIDLPSVNTPSYLIFSVYAEDWTNTGTGGSTDQNLKANGLTVYYNVPSGDSNGNTSNNRLAFSEATAGAWTQIVVPVTDVYDNMVFAGMGNDDDTAWIDDVYLIDS